MNSILETNTHQFHDNILFEELLVIYRRYREFGDRYLMMGSNASLPECLSYYFNKRGKIEVVFHIAFVCFSGREKS